MLAIGAGIVFARERDAVPFGEALGRGLGMVIACLLVALAVRLVYARVRGGDRRTFSPYVLLIAGFLSLLLFLSEVGRDARDAATVNGGTQAVAAAAASSSRSSPQKT